ncbi:MAG: DUF4258 domain-containing protein [Methanosarcinales archaeon]|nr:DUF4258 domain-containing protein [ANME-2 cluster archaeon]MDW7774989.1 DUF4258 domain-containing protein [Methanosarcinales archaeon]
MNIIFSEHAIFEINRRKIKKENIENLVKYPPQKLDGKNNRIIIQGKYLDKDQNKEMLLRIIGEELDDNFYIITTYKTSKIDKYWKGENYESSL